eukprot:CAMPEP_0113280184 /NCGR_PEP_ID=MMETSP0008_2-20120614/27598_1 /TAXON_ID=97485 /ORGANISM="Prymnesium parvum" /LENGTH=53 /DNA_ID=CAMNT_0000130449 /DNA_START=851 /DNA_END=1012 /DNA_ORIENTATION=- /assembly_acc=CAM_ASM_000153
MSAHQVTELGRWGSKPSVEVRPVLRSESSTIESGESGTTRDSTTVMKLREEPS